MNSLESVVLIGSFFTAAYLAACRFKQLKFFAVTFASVLVFEVCTGGLWVNKGFSSWSYLYGDLCWILTLGWTLIILIPTLIVERFIKGPELLRFVVIAFLASAAGIIAEGYVLHACLREYSADVTSSLSGTKIFSSGVPIEALYYIPAFMVLIICTARYWRSRES